MHNPFALLGYQHIKDILQQQTAHALILVGPERTGRKLLAHHVAAQRNCNTLNACGHCPSCMALQKNTHPDVLYVSPKTETSTGKTARKKLIPVSAITQKRDRGKDYEQHVVEWLYIAPHYKRKVVIVDGAEYLNEEAANALLKTLEEPPYKAMFVFITEDIRQVLPTITSRSTRVLVPPASPEDMQHALTQWNIPHNPELLAFASGRMGVLSQHTDIEQALKDARDWVKAVEESMLAALQYAESLEKRFNPSLHPEALLFVLRDRSLNAQSHADNAVQHTLDVLEQYANASLALQVLSLKLRQVLA